MNDQDARVWVLTERWRDGSDHIEGIALTNDAMSAWVRGGLEVGHARTGLPYQIIGGNPLAAELARLHEYVAMIHAHALRLQSSPLVAGLFTQQAHNALDICAIERISTTMAALLAETADQTRVGDRAQSSVRDPGRRALDNIPEFKTGVVKE